jgi:hypothetical protein
LSGSLPVYVIPGTLHVPTGESALVGELQAALPDRFAQRRVHQFVDVELHLVSRVSGDIEDVGVHTDCVLGAHLYTVSTVDADPQVDVEADWVLLDIGVGVLPSHNGDALGRADCLAEHASHAAGRPLISNGEPVAAPESRLERPALFGVLEGGRSWEELEQSQAVRHVKRKVPEKMCGGDLKAAEDLRNIKLFPKSQLSPANNAKSDDLRTPLMIAPGVLEARRS